MCHITTAQLTADGQAVGTAIDNIAEAIQATDTSLAAKLEAAGTAVVNATKNWQEGSALNDVEDAEQAAITVLNVVPVTSQFAPLVAICFTALNLLIANSQTQTTQASATGTVAAAHALLQHESTLNTDSPWHGKAQIHHHFLNPPRKDFESAYNQAAKPLGVKEVTV